MPDRQILDHEAETAAAPARSDWHAMPVAEVRRRLETGPAGLSAAEARRRLERDGPNRLTPQGGASLWKRLARQFANALILILVAAAAVMLVIGEYLDAAVVAAVVIINAAIGFVQEGKAEKAMDAIRDMLSPKAAVLRDGKRLSIPAEELVVGDLVRLESGDKVPADLRIVEARGLEIQESALTGESLSVTKRTEPVAADAALGDRSAAAYSGTLVTRGAGAGIVTATGDATEIGRIGRLLAGTEAAQTPLMAQVDRFGRWLTLAILGLGGVTFLFGTMVQGFTALEMFQAAVGVAVAAIPEGLPAILTTTLAIGVTRMARRNAIIRRMPAVETLGAVSVICTDKTGTLTRNEMTVASVVTSAGIFTVGGVGYGPEGEILDRGGDAAETPVLHHLARAGMLCNDAGLEEAGGQWRVLGDPVDGALLAFAAKAGLDREAEARRWPRSDAVPFESDRAYMATLDAHADHPPLIHVKGAPEVILRRCTAQMTPEGGHGRMDADYWFAAVDELARGGQRVLAVARRHAPEPGRLHPAHAEEDLTLLGLVGLIDPPRTESVDAVAACGRAGVQVKMITGDHAVTAGAIGRAVGLSGGVIAGPELDRLDGDAFVRAAHDNAVFARATPEHKIRLVEALRGGGGNIVAMTGDGVNDAPALKRADVGVAMGAKGTEAAKEAADMVLADDNFATIVNAVEEGRTVFDNLRKALIFVLPTSFGQAGSIVFAVFLGMAMPITPLQILWVNLVTAVTLSISLAFDPSEPGIMGRRPRPPDVPILSGFLVWRIALVTALMTAVAVWAFMDAIASGRSEAEARTLVVNALVLFEVMYLFNCRALVASALRLPVFTGNRIAVYAVLGVLALQALFTYAPPLQYLFDTAPLTAADWGRLALAATGLFLLVEGEKALRGRFG